MRSLLLAITFITLASAYPIPTLRWWGRDHIPLHVLEYVEETAYTKFTVPCPAGSCSRADDALVFELQVHPPGTLDQTPNITVNGHTLDLDQSVAFPHSSATLFATTALGARYALGYGAETASHDVFRTSSDAEDVLTQYLSLHIYSIDASRIPAFSFHIESQPTTKHRLRKLSLSTQKGGPTFEVDFRESTETFLTRPLSSPRDSRMSPLPKDVSHPPAGKADSLRLLEDQVEQLRKEMTAKKQAIFTHLREHQDHMSLGDLLKECDGLICAANIIAQRLCDRVTALKPSTSGYARLPVSDQQHITSYREQLSESSRNDSRSTLSQTANNIHEEVNVPLILTKNASATEYSLIDMVDPPNPFLRALQILASVLGLAALFAYIRRKCMSMRKRVERAADREERRNARAYRKAARRAEMRRRWTAFVSAVNCFRSPAEVGFSGVGDYEEKRALILQDAFLEQQLGDAEMGEKGEVMEAEIRELRFAHDIVASLVRADERRGDLVTLANDPPPPLVPLPYTPTTRSRASTHTLPSYTSESLPGYSSQVTTSSVADDVTVYSASSSEEEEEGSLVTPPSARSWARQSLASSVLDVSPRISKETIRTVRTGQSRDVQEL